MAIWALYSPQQNMLLPLQLIHHHSPTPPFPGAAAGIPPNSTGHQITAIEQQFNKSLRQWTKYKNLTDAGKKFIQDGIDDMYLKGITDRNVGLAHVTIRDILAFLFQNYGNITQYDIEENNKKLKEKWDANTPIEMLFDQIDDAQDFAVATGQPYTNNQLLTMAYNLVYATGLFFDDCKTWNRLPPNQKTMENFKTTFQQAQQELHNQQCTPNKQVSRLMAFGANPFKTVTILSKRQKKHWPT